MERRLLTLIAVFLVTAFLILRIAAKNNVERGAPSIPSIPLTVGDWKGRRIAVSDEIFYILRASHIEHVLYRNGSGDEVGLYIVWESKDRESFHPPEYCLVAQSGGSIIDKKSVRISLGKREIVATAFVLARDHRKRYVLYWYRAGSYYTPSYYAHQLAFIRKLVGWGGEESMLVRLITDMDSKGAAGASERIQNLLNSIVTRYNEL